MIRKQQIQENKETILAITAKHGAYNVRIFGSVARGEENLESDTAPCAAIEPR